MADVLWTLRTRAGAPQVNRAGPCAALEQAGPAAPLPRSSDDGALESEMQRRHFAGR